MARNERKFNIVIDLNSRQVVSDFKKVSREADKMSNSTTASVKKIDVAIGSFLGTLAAGAATAGAGLLLDVGKSALQVAKDMEVLNTQFTVLTGSAEEAEKVLTDLKEFAAQTPFQLPGLAAATKQLIQAKVPQEELIETLRKIGDIAAVTGRSIEDLAIPFARLRDRGSVTLEELQKFDDAGAGLARTMSEILGVSIAEVRKQISAGKVSFETFSQAIDQVTSKGGTFADGMLKQSETLAGKISTLQDNWTNFLDVISKSNSGILKDAVEGVTTAINTITNQLRKLEGARTEVEKLKESIDFDETLISIDAELGQDLIPSLEKDKARLQELTMAKEEAAAKEKEINEQAKFEREADAAVLADQQQRALERLGEIGVRKEEILSEQRQKDFEKLQEARELEAITEEEFQKRKLEIFRLHLEEVNKLKEADDKAQAKKDKLKKERERKAEAAKLKVKATTNAMIIDNEAKTFQLLSTIVGQGSKEQFLIQQALAFAQIAIADGRARAGAFASTAAIPFPGNLTALSGLLAAITANTALSTGIVAAQTVQGLASFQNGGILNAGGSNITGDQNLARFNDREMFLNMRQQSTLFNAIDSGAIGGGNTIVSEQLARTNELLELVAAKDLSIDCEKLNNELTNIDQRAL